MELKTTLLFPKPSNFLVNFCNFFVKNLLKFKTNQLTKLYLLCIKEVGKLQASEEGTFLSFTYAVVLLGVIISNDA